VLPLTRAVFLDRDGVINRKALEDHYVTRWEEFHILPGVVEGITLLNRTGFCVIVVTNQRGIAKGLMTAADLEKMHERMSALFARSGATIDAIYFCPHEVDQFCNCRKPAPGMLLDAARSRGIDLSASWMIGDSDIDVKAGKNAGCKTVRVLSTNASEEESVRRAASPDDADLIAMSLLDAVGQVLKLDGAAVGSFPADPART
jgi:D-glycero-D-manno-heptose 1,7-bisphosphate phosphatase